MQIDSLRRISTERLGPCLCYSITWARLYFCMSPDVSGQWVQIWMCESIWKVVQPSNPCQWFSFRSTHVFIRMLHKCHTNAPLITNCFSLTLAIDIRETPIFWGNESPSGGIPIWIQNKDLLLVLQKYNKRQLSLSGNVQAHDTNTRQTKGINLKCQELSFVRFQWLVK